MAVEPGGAPCTIKVLLPLDDVGGAAEHLFSSRHTVPE